MSEFRVELTPSLVEIFYGPHQEGINVRLGDIDIEHRQACIDLLTENGFEQKAGYVDPAKNPNTLVKDLVDQLATNFPIGERSADTQRYLIGPHSNSVFGVGIWEHHQPAA
jgi:hypothetical protein